jgi:hypothetical protein
MMEDSGWIVAAERQPPRNQTVLYFVERHVATGYMGVELGSYEPSTVFPGEYEKGSWPDWRSDRSGWSAFFVTYWMPLPAPPRGKRYT